MCVCVCVFFIIIILVLLFINIFFLTGKQAFFVLRCRENTVQCVIAVGEKVSKQMIKYVCNINKESIIDVEGKVCFLFASLDSFRKKMRINFFSLCVSCWYILVDIVTMIFFSILNFVCSQVVVADQKVESCSVQDVEIHVSKVFAVSSSSPRLPLQVFYFPCHHFL